MNRDDWDETEIWDDDSAPSGTERSAVTPAPGVDFGVYEVVERLGAGGMGEVWRAWDPSLEREVALKVLPAEMTADETARARLLREARMASKLNHPNVCTIYEVGEAEGQAYIAMELVAGEALSARLSKPGDWPRTKCCASGARWRTPWRTPTPMESCTATSRAPMS